MQNEFSDLPVATRIDVPAIADDSLIAIAEQAEKRIDAIKKIKSIALRVTNTRDWTNQNGNPYLQVSGAEKVGRLFGISWRISEPVFSADEGGHFSYTYKGEFSLGGQTIEVIGTRSSKDPFFKKYDYSEKDDEGKPKKKELPPSEIDKGDVKKAAYTNCIGNGVTRILGIRNLTWEEVEEFAKVKRGEVAGVEYKKGGKEQAGKPGNGGESPPMSDAQRKKLWAMMKGKKLSDESCKKVLATIKTVREASAAIENFETRLQGFMAQDTKKEEPKTVHCPDDGEECTTESKKTCNRAAGCPAWD